MADLRQHFRPEFLNRVDETVLFKPLGLEEIEKIVDLLLADLNRRLAGKRVTVVLDDKAKEGLMRRATTRSSAPARSSASSNDTSRSGWPAR